MDFAKIKSDFRREIVREGSAYLDGQLKIATSADSRASGLAGMFTAAATGMTVGVVIAIYNASGTSFAGKLPMILGGSTAAILFLAAAVLCITAIMPVEFWLPGLAPENWAEDVASGRELDDCLGERVDHIQNQIDANLKAIQTNARYFKRGAMLGIIAPFAGVIVWLLSSLCKFMPPA